MTLSLSELDSHLFKCADIIRDAVDPTDYKEFILPLVYYKAISDEYEKQFQQNVEKYGDEELARRRSSIVRKSRGAERSCGNVCWGSHSTSSPSTWF